jgi:hypothetical protein
MLQLFACCVGRQGLVARVIRVGVITVHPRPTSRYCERLCPLLKSVIEAQPLRSLFIVGSDRIDALLQVFQLSLVLSCCVPDMHSESDPECTEQNALAFR